MELSRRMRTLWSKGKMLDGLQSLLSQPLYRDTDLRLSLACSCSQVSLHSLQLNVYCLQFNWTPLPNLSNLSIFLDPITQVCSPCTRPGVYITTDDKCANCSSTCLACSIQADNCTACLHPRRPLADSNWLFSCILDANSSHMILQVK